MGQGHRRHVSDDKKRFARELRADPPPAAALLWTRLREKRTGWRFRRRAILFGWIVDFWCPAARVAVEIDHASDEERMDEHAHRDQVLQGRGIRVIRVPWSDVVHDLGRVANDIRQICEQHDD